MKFTLFTNPTDRRGVLLLLVLSVLTLFLLMGAMLLTLATRARTGARAFAMVTGDLEASSALPRALLDEALMILIRGSTDEDVQDAVTESLLGDMYGESGNKVPFREEPFDAFGTDPFLTEFNDDGTVKTAAFGSGAGAIDVDNDADGTLDGVWLEDVLPEMASSSGGTLSFRVSYLVHDLDARINVNAHGGGGDPVGPASIDASDLPPFGNSAWTFLQQGGERTGPPAGSGQRRPPRIGRRVDGRGGNAYGLRLDRDAPRPAALTGQATQNPFTPGELERVLRPFDPDCATLPPRLAALLDDLDGSARRLVTTDSWDVASRTGAAAIRPTPQAKFDVLRPLDQAVNEITEANGDLAKTQLLKQAKLSFARQLFNAISEIAGDSQTTAQWAANVAEFALFRRAGFPGFPAAPVQPEPLSIGQFMVTGVAPPTMNGTTGEWQGLASTGDLLAIPRGTRQQIEDVPGLLPLPNPSSPLHSLIISYPAIIDALMFTRFRATLDGDLAGGRLREPGRVNINTAGQPVRSLVGSPPVNEEKPHLSLWTVLRQVIQAGWKPDGEGAPADYKAFDVRAVRGLRERLNTIAASAAVRSNVFAVWITLEVNDSSLDSGSPTCHRLFAIVDRSVPVDYQEGENTDVRKTIRLKRFLN